MTVSDLATRDYGDIVMALQEGPFVPAVASFHIAWTKSRNKQRFRDEPNQWRANVVLNAAEAEWSAESAAVQYVSDPAETSFSLFAEVGHERNGVFFS